MFNRCPSLEDFCHCRCLKEMNYSWNRFQKDGRRTKPQAHNIMKETVKRSYFNEL